MCRRARNGDTQAFAELYEKCAGKLYSTAFYMLGRKEDAEDIVMETVTDAFAEIGSLRKEEAFEGWLFKILVTKIKKKRGSYITEALPLMDDVVHFEKGDSDENAALWKALESIGEEDRQIIILDVLCGYKSHEISAMMNMNANTVRSRRMRAMQKLKKMLEDKGADRS